MTETTDGKMTPAQAFDWHAYTVLAEKTLDIRNTNSGDDFARIRATTDEAVNTVAAYFLTMPAEPDEIAAWLRERGIMGMRGACSACPIANLAKFVFGVDLYVSVDQMSVRSPEGYLSSLSTPRHIGRFVELFDYDRYPDLVGYKPVREAQYATVE